MKAKTLIFLLMTLFLIGIFLTGLSQGIINNGGFITDAGTTSHSFIEFNGSADMILSGTTADQTTLGNLKVDFSGTGTYKLTISNNSYITLEGNLILSDSLILEANSSSNMASLITNGTITGSLATVQEHLTQDQYHIVSSPIASATAAVYAGCYLLKWQESDSTWTYVSSLIEPLSVTTGYLVWSASDINSPTDVKYTGLLNTGNQTATLTYTSAATHGGQGWNIAGNPFPSAIDWNTSTAWNRTNLSATMYVRDGANFKTWNYNLGGYGTKLDGSIPSTQGFWVKATAANPTMVIPNSERIHSTQVFYKGGGNNLDIIRINISGNGYSDQMIIGMMQEATDNFDSEFDAYKLMGIEASPQLYSLVGSTKCAVNILNNIKEDKTIPVSFRIGEANKYSFEVGGLGDFNPSMWIYLEDKFAGSMTNLRENPIYAFYTEEGLNEERFVLHFRTCVNDLAENVLTSDVNIYSFDDIVLVNYQLDVPGQVHIYDILGKEILSEKLDPNQLNKLIINTDKGYYVVKVIFGANIKTRKVLIN